ncbi:MAG: MBL fold metallo-hydrolase [Alphaproteobacteria bacterium]|nr:MBL fold metallo-hydrolase [Alphaproteobacteria bacterium]
MTKFEIIKMPPENTNSVLLTSGSDAAIFDPWGRTENWEKLLAARGLDLRAIYATHGHGDHISAAALLADKLNVPWHMSHKDLNISFMVNPLIEYFGLPPVPKDTKLPLDLPAGKVEVLPGIAAEIYDAPGHSKGGLVFYLESAKLLIIGDTLFQDTVGAYHFPGGDPSELKRSISKIYELNLPDDTLVIHGHGPETTIGWLKENNKYFK